MRAPRQRRSDGKLTRLPELAETVHVYFGGNDRAPTISDNSKGSSYRLDSTVPARACFRIRPRRGQSRR